VTAGTKGTKPSARYETPNAAARKAAAAHRRPGLTAASEPTGGGGGGGGTPAGYANPLRDIAGITGERIDMGVDYAGTGPIYAVGPARITAATASGSGWPGGGWVSYEVTEGPLKGHHIYVAEDITPAVHAGQVVDSRTVIANLHTGSSGMETGFADPNAPYTTLAATSGQAAAGDPGRYSTSWGILWNDILVRLGAPTGTLNPGPPASNPYGYSLTSFPKWVNDIPIIGPIIGSAGGAASGISETGHWLGVIGAAITDRHLYISLGWLFLGVFLLFLGAYLLVRLSSAYRSAEGTALKAAAVL
jgi:hypothetical protein